MARTRATKGSDVAAATTKSTSTLTTTSKYTLPPSPTTPPKIFILPTKATKEARIVSLLHPRYAKPTRYLVCPESGIYEFTRIAAPKTTPRSWLIHGDVNASSSKSSEEKGEKDFGTHVTNGAELFIATPFDPLFLVLPTLIDPSQNTKRQYISSDDHFDRIQSSSPHLWEILRNPQTRSLLEDRLASVCDTVDAGDERMFRFSEEKLCEEIMGKAKRMSARELPRSMEQKFVVKPLEAPVLGVKRAAVVPKPAEKKEAEVVESGDDSQSSTNSHSTTTSDAASQPSTATTSFTSTPNGGDDEEEALLLLQPAMTASPEVLSQQRLRVAFNFLISSYIPPALAPILQSHLQSQKVDSSALDLYLAELTRLKQEAAATRNKTASSRKHERMEEEEEAAERAEKRRKKEEEEKRKKAGESRGFKQLQKVDTKGMRKMSDFFKKKA
ncbi:ribonuclease H2, subunit B [Xylariaceae sp. FL0255]|nr:ribonuclease H2, subunit B [Xylariaceae sp. FL0255]